MTHNQSKVNSEIDTIDARREKEINRIALREFNARVVPFCKKYQLTFSSGMGTFALYDKNKNTIEPGWDTENWNGAKLEELKEIWELLSTDCGNNSLGEYMPDYKGV